MTTIFARLGGIGVGRLAAGDEVDVDAESIRLMDDAERAYLFDLASGNCLRRRDVAHALAGPLEPLSLICSVISAAFVYADRPRIGIVARQAC
jgi:hypothetical protein